MRKTRYTKEQMLYVYIQRLERGTFEWPGSGKLQLSAQELMLILSGIKLTSVQMRKRYAGFVTT